jgi:hypothetical protein
VDRVPCQEWIDHPAFIKDVTGVDPYDFPEEAVVALLRELDIDWYGGIPKHSVRFAKNETKKDMGGGRFVSEWGFTGSGWSMEPPFHTYEEVLSYNPLEKSTAQARKEGHRRTVEHIMASNAMVGPISLILPSYYTTLFQSFIMTFGWAMFLETAAAEPERFKRLLDWYTQISMEYTAYYAENCELPVFFAHDDLALTRGLVFRPNWYRENIFPNYERIFEPLKKAGKKIVFVSDGNYSELIDDLIAVGVDGLMIDQYVNLERLMKRYGGSIAVVGNADVAPLTFGTPVDVRNEVKKCMDAAKNYPGYIIRCHGDLPQNIPMENMYAYFEACREYGRV